MMTSSASVFTLNNDKNPSDCMLYRIVPSSGLLLSESMGSRPLKVEQNSFSQLNSCSAPFIFW